MSFQYFFIRAFTLLFLSTASSHAALVSCATSSNSTMCSLCDVFVTGNTIVNYFSGILLPIALVSLTLGGILYLMNRVDQAKGIITASVLGIILSLSAFLIVNLTMRALGVPQTSWNSYTCTPQVAQATPKTDGTTFNTSGEGGPKDTVGNPGDITGDPTVTPTTPICNENRDTSSIPMTLPLVLTLNCTNPDQIVSAIWRFPSDSNFGTQNVNNKEGITFTSIDNPSNWTEVTVVVTDTKGRGQTYVYGFGGSTAGPGGVTSINMCPPGQSYPDSKFGQYHDLPSRQMYKNTDPTRTYTIEFPIKDVTTAGKITAQLPQIRYELPVGVSNDWDATVSRNPCDFSSSAQVLINTGNSGWRYFTVDDTRTSPAGTLNLAPGKWYINFKQARKCLTPGIPESSPNQNDCGIFFELTPNELQEYIGESTGVTNNSPAMVAVSGYAGGMGTAAAQAILSTAFLKDENLNWAQLCGASGPRSLPSDGHLGYDGLLVDMTTTWQGLRPTPRCTLSIYLIPPRGPLISMR